MSIAPASPLPVLKASDFATDQDVRWCPGCGDYSILMQTKKVLAKLGVDKSKTVFISGIGCSSRFPYYLNTYGFHSIHGRAPTFATGLKLARPELNIWIATGDGDALSIGGNHFLHIIRRNLDVKILLFNNRIYGLTKGQYSPTSEHGKKTKSTPMGAPDYPIRPLSIAIAAGATFAARSIDVDVKHLEYVLERAAKHSGTAVVEIYQNCNIFNDGAFDYATDKTTKSDTTIYLEQGKPLVFGKNAEKGIRLREMNPEVVSLTDTAKDDLLVHNEQAQPAVPFLLSRMRQPDLPEPMGILRDVEKERYVSVVRKQNEDAIAKQGVGDIQSLMDGPETWTVS
ncbi:MAG: 2-oxoglutarate/2-oxoacid ferredoxin oxidoreductase subunit beta [Phycisphaerales bacterium]|jgi:2-oxoglutarate ferredoxin oxidoreductase subunit beta|nr:2-oxoglutarate/2-oxoacid ferredoxin oxidoreductase subunit beta [Phycisphaerales bacterium]